MWRNIVCLVAVVALCVPAICLAQDSSSGQGGYQSGAQQGGSGTMQRDWSGGQAGGMQGMQGRGMQDAMAARNAFIQGHIASMLALFSQSEIALGQIAVDKAKNNDVKQFAQTLVKEHQNSVDQLSKILPQAIVSRLRLQELTQVAQNAVQRAGQGGQGTPYTVMRPAGDDTNISQSPTPLLDLEVNAVQNWVGLSTAELIGAQNVDFDKAFVGQQIAAHINLLSKLRAVDAVATGQLKQIVQNDEKVTIQHLNQLKQIMDNLQKS